MRARSDVEEQSAVRTSRLALVPLAPIHARPLFALMNDWDVVRMLAVVPWPLTLADVENHARAHIEGRGEADEFAILLDVLPIGVCGVKRPGSGDPPRKMPRLGYWIGRKYWGRGLATEAIGALIAHAFDLHPGDVVGAGVFQDNPASRRVLEKLGFTAVGGYRTFSRSRGEEVETVDMRVRREAFEARTQ